MFVHSDRASILHADLDAFYASVEQRDAPELLGRPVIVGGGVVLSASYEARARGVRTAMGGSRARRLCPDAVVVKPRFSAYTQASRVVFEIFRQFAPTVEALSIDEAFLDVSGLERITGTPAQIAARLREAVRELAGLPITVGVARTKFLAKVASGVAKPDGLLVVEPAAEQAFLWPLGVGRLWGVGAVSEAKLAEHGITTVGQVAAIGEAALGALVGPGLARRLHALAEGRDPRPVKPRQRRRSIGAQRALGRGPHSLAEVRIALLGLVDRVARRLRAAGRLCRTVVLRLRFGDYTRATRSRTLPAATAETGTLVAAATALLRAALPLIEARGLTLIGVALAGLRDAAGDQLALSFTRGAELDRAVDRVRERFGTASLVRGVVVGRGGEQEVPLLPD